MNIQETIVLDILTDGTVKVLPILSSACTTCQQACEKRGTAFTVVNPKNFEIKKGSLIKVGASGKWQLFQSLYSLFLPIISAFAGYFLAPDIASLFNKKAGEGMRALLALLFMFTSSLIIYFLSKYLQKLFYKWTSPEILEIL
ncbi:MAG: SoxR reducing system RseC family protein [Treponema sp.]|nr:SoxR reducing system RseC family protein [Treponema sp.]